MHQRKELVIKPRQQDAWYQKGVAGVKKRHFKTRKTIMKRHFIPWPPSNFTLRATGRKRKTF